MADGTIRASANCDDALELARTDEEREALWFWREADDKGRERIVKGISAILSGEIKMTAAEIRAADPNDVVAMLDTLPSSRLQQAAAQLETHA